jgi:hypothetical protein
MQWNIVEGVSFPEIIKKNKKKQKKTDTHTYNPTCGVFSSYESSVSCALLVRKFPLKLTDPEGSMVNSCEVLINITR